MQRERAQYDIDPFADFMVEVKQATSMGVIHQNGDQERWEMLVYNPGGFCVIHLADGLEFGCKKGRLDHCIGKAYTQSILIREGERSCLLNI